ncbi:extracellular solute-binding protein [Jeotgalibaca sp. MA1X17-3]|uniref:extracellular solute-binding protein n=1 Tax=Jeotgalibaca sp. MA1X17-3 TaxID=2908211 RepID=UPI001F3FB9B2|nr:extracellular solute-binding protein [Jeotgalibaca sp. MA1X17-3]UJF15631.1 extracellular solute-binding protein [Jeotgalibaca sp. MA1X17-3]
MKKKRFISLLTSFSIIATVLAGCGNETSGDSQTDSSANVSGGEQETVELTVWEVSRGADEFREEQEQAFLKEYPWIKLNKVVKEGDPGNDFYQAVSSGTAPDFIEASFTMIDKFIAAGVVEPLNGYMDSWDESGQFNETYLDMFTKDGNMYTLPNEISPMLFGYNKKLFKEAGIENPPANWDEALEIAKKINDPEKQIAGYATLTAEWTEWFFQYYVWQAGGDLTQENEDGTIELTFTDPAVIEAAEYYQELASSKVLQSDRTLKFGDLLTQFSQDKIAMMPFATDWIKDVANQGMDIDDIGLIIPPVGSSGEPVTAIGGSGYLINAKTSQAKKDAAWEYISWFMSNEQRTAFYENVAGKGALAPIILGRTDMSASDFGDFPEEYDQVLEEANDIGRFEFYGKADFASYVDRAVQKILADPNADPEKEFREAQELAEKEVLESFNELNKVE